jgi:hypothetical protein
MFMRGIGFAAATLVGPTQSWSNPLFPTASDNGRVGIHCDAGQDIARSQVQKTLVTAVP